MPLFNAEETHAVQWKNQIKRKATYNGIPFNLTSDSGDGGKSGPDHEFPNGREAWSEILSNKQEGRGVSGYTVGDSTTPRDDLIRACRADGEGVLFIPTAGEFKVVLRQWSWREDRTEIRRTNFSFIFKLVGEKSGATRTAVLGKATKDAATKLLDVSALMFSDNYEVDDQTGGVFEDALSVVNNVNDLLSYGSEFLQDSIDIKNGNYTHIMKKIAGRFGLGDLFAGVMETQALIDGLRGQMAILNEDVKTPVELAQLPEFPFADVSFNSNGDLSRTDQNNQAILDFSRHSMLAEKAKTIVLLDFDSRTQAAEIRDAVLLDLKAEIKHAGSLGQDETYAALKGLQSAFLKDMKTASTDLAPLVTYEWGSTVPSLTLAHALYSDGGRSGELETRNSDHLNPAFLPASGEALAK